MNELVKLDVSVDYAPKVYIHKRKWGWYWKFQLPNGTWFYCRAPGDDEKAAKRNTIKKEKELSKGLFTKKEIDKLQESSNTLTTFALAIDDFIDDLEAEGKSPKYIKTEKARLVAAVKTLEEATKAKHVHKITEDHAFNFRKFLLWRVKREEIRRVTAFNNLNAIKRLYKWLKKRKRIPSNPWVEIDAIPVPREERARNVAPSNDILHKLLSAKYVHRYAFPTKEFVYGLYRTGARNEELLYLEIDDVNWETGEWTIKPKECPTRYGMKWSPKYGKRRTVFIPKDVLEMLLPLVDRAMRHRVVGYAPDKKGKIEPVDAGFIFTMLDRKLSTKKETIYRRVDNIRGAWGALFYAAGLTEPKVSSSPSTKKYKNGRKVRTDYSVPYTRHDMRRGFNLEAKRAGMPIDMRAAHLGHSREVNEANYLGKPDIDAAETVAIINEKMWKSGKKGA